MPSNTSLEERDEAVPSKQTSFQQKTAKVKDLFSIPAPVKALFDTVPVLTYPPNNLPQRAPKPARIPSLYVFIDEKDAAAGRPSYNPSCLKWQVRKAKINTSMERFLILFVGIPEHSRHKPPSSPLQQPRLPHRRPPLPPPSLRLSTHPVQQTRAIRRKAG